MKSQVAYDHNIDYWFEQAKAERMDKLILLWESPLDLDVLCYTPEEFKMKKEEICIVKQAVEEGVVIAG
jgi:hypothetical protein